MTNLSKTKADITPIQRRGNGVTLGHIAYTKSWEPLFRRPQTRFGRVIKTYVRGYPLPRRSRERRDS